MTTHCAVDKAYIYPLDVRKIMHSCAKQGTRRAQRLAPDSGTHEWLVGQAAVEGSTLGVSVHASSVEQLALIEEPAASKAHE
jgi:hypothetical protein